LPGYIWVENMSCCPAIGNRACQLVGLENIPVITRELDYDVAVMVVETNLPRDEILPFDPKKNQIFYASNLYLWLCREGGYTLISRDQLPFPEGSPKTEKPISIN